MTRIISLMMCLCMMFGMFVGCAKTDEAPEETMVTPTETIEKAAEWELNVEEIGCAMPTEVTDIFLSATEKEVVRFVPVAYVANRVVENGMIYRILCQTIECETPVNEDILASDDLDGGANIAIEAESKVPINEVGNHHESPIDEKIIFELAMVDILVDSDDKAKIDMVENFDLNKIMTKTAEEMNDEAILEMDDGWIKNLEQSASVISDDILMLFDNAVGENYMFFEELSYLGSQTVENSTNFSILCYQTSVDEVPITQMAVMFISMTSDAVEITNIVTM